MATCTICCETFSASRKDITCFACNIEACTQCVKKYILSVPTDAHCMSCKKEWSHQFLSDNMTQSFMNGEYKTHRKDILYDRERAMLPATQPYVGLAKRIDRRKVRIEEVNKKLAELDKQMVQTTSPSLIKEINKDISFYKQERRVIKRDVIQLRRMFAGVEPIDNNTTVSHVIKPCPSQGCKGFLNRSWACGLCKTKCCSKCHVQRGDPEEIHVCKPEDLETAELLRKETKPCPKCGAPCFKVDGCDQVFAVCCRTTFSWSKGTIEYGPIHSPDYYRWLREQGHEVPRNTLDVVACGDGGVDQGILPAQYLVTTLFTRSYQYAYLNTILDIYRLIIHVRYVELPRYQFDPYNSNRDIRIKYMIDPEMTEAKFKMLLVKREKAQSLKQDIFDTMNTFATVGTDIMHRIVNIAQETDNGSRFACPGVVDILKEADVLRTYCNETFGSIQKRYQTSYAVFIDEHWIIDKS